MIGAGTRWPDLAVAGAMAGLFLNSSAQILRRALAELREVRAAAAATAGSR